MWNPTRFGLGTLLFFIYINDIPNSSRKLRFYLFAVDRITLLADKNLKIFDVFSVKLTFKKSSCTGTIASFTRK